MGLSKFLHCFIDINIGMMFILFNFLIVIIFNNLKLFVNSKGCSTVKSDKHGTLMLGRNNENPSICLGSLYFMSGKDGKKFCLKKGGKKTERLESSSWKCGQENIPEAQNKITGGDLAGEHQYPWHAALYAVDLPAGLPIKYMYYCGGSLISTKVVLTAVHCGQALEEFKVINIKKMVGLGLTKLISPIENPEYFKKVEKVVPHQFDTEGNKENDISLYILENPVVFTWKVRPVCLPEREQDLELLETSPNILPGFGTQNIWLIEYEKLLGGREEIIRMDLFTEENIKELIRNPKFWRPFIEKFFKTFVDLFPGLDLCLKDNNIEFDLECWPYKIEEETIKINEETVKIIDKNMRAKLEKSNNGEKEIEDFLKTTHAILKMYGAAVMDMKKERAHEDKIKAGIFGHFFKTDPEITEEQKSELKRKLKYLDQWIFMQTVFSPPLNIGMDMDIIPRDQTQLRKAQGKFTSWDEWEKTESISQKHSTKIPAKRFNVTNGFGCTGDSGGGLVVKNKDGRYVVVGVTSHTLGDGKKFPPSCWCNCEDLPETHTRVSQYIQWIKDKRSEIEDDVS